MSSHPGEVLEMSDIVFPAKAPRTYGSTLWWDGGQKIYRLINFQDVEMNSRYLDTATY